MTFCLLGSAILDRIGREFVQGHREGLNCAGAHERRRNGNPDPTWCGIEWDRGYTRDGEELSRALDNHRRSIGVPGYVGTRLMRDHCP